MKKGNKFRIYPTAEQKEQIKINFGCCRFVYNFSLAQQRKEEKLWYLTEELYQSGMLSQNNYKGKFFNKKDAINAIPELKKNYPWLKQADSIALQAAVENLAFAYDAYYDKTKNNGKPVFKSKLNPVQSYTTKMVNNNIEIDENYIKLPKLGKVRFAKSKNLKGKIKRATISQSSSGKYFVSVLEEVDILPMQKTGSEIGIDVGIVWFATLSTGVQYKNPKSFQSLENKLGKEQRKLARKVKNSSNWNKQKIKIALIHEEIVNKRKDYLQKLSTEIVKNHDLIGMEDLKVQKMQKEKKLSKVISDASWAEFRTMIEYKSEWYGKKLVLVSPEYTSQKCNACGHIEKDNRKSQSKFVCISCNHEENADINAAKNIEELAKCA